MTAPARKRITNKKQNEHNYGMNKNKSGGKHIHQILEYLNDTVIYSGKEIHTRTKKWLDYFKKKTDRNEDIAYRSSRLLKVNTVINEYM